MYIYLKGLTQSFIHRADEESKSKPSSGEDFFRHEQVHI